MCSKEHKKTQRPDAAQCASGLCVKIKNALKGLLAVIFITVFYLAVSWAGNKVEFLSPWKQAMESYRLSDLYCWMHKSPKAVTYNGVGVVTIDISSCKSRGEIASLIDRINSCEPCCVGVDVIFPNLSADASPAEDDSLVAAFSRTRNLVLAQEFRPISGTEYSPKTSFFVEQLPGARQGVVSLPSGIIREWTPLLVFGNDTLPSFTKAIADLAGVPMPATTEPQMIDYSISDTMTLKADETWEPEFLKGQIVLVGDLEDLRDTHEIPVTLQKSAREAGLNIHRQILQTSMEGKQFHVVPKWLTLTVSGLLLWIISMLLIPLVAKANALAGSLQAKEGGVTLLDYAGLFFLHHASAIAQTTLIVLAVIVGYILYWKAGLMFEIKFLLSGYALLYAGNTFVDSFLRFLDAVRNTFTHKKAK